MGRKVLGPVEQRVQLVVDKAAPYPVGRWIGFAVLLTLYGTWVYTRPGWYIVTYGLGIYMLNLLVGFVTPIEDPDAGDGRPLLPVRGDDTEAKPLQTKLPELKFWTRAVRAVLVAFTLTLFDAFNVEVFWPILLFYFIMLFFFTCRRQVRVCVCVPTSMRMRVRRPDDAPWSGEWVVGWLGRLVT